MIQPKAWIVPVLLLLLCAVFASLGRWQLARAEVNRNIEQRFVEAETSKPIELPLSRITADEHQYRRIHLTGRYESKAQVLLDNMTRAGQPGYEVLTPFVVEGSSDRVIVNRGWVEASLDRSELPAIDVDEEPIAISGRIDSLPRVGLDLGDAPVYSGEPVSVLSFPNFDDIETVLGLSVLPFQVKLDEDAADGFFREWGPEAGRDDQNIAYAVQWFAFSALAFLIAIGAIVRQLRSRRVAVQ